MRRNQERWLSQRLLDRRIHDAGDALSLPTTCSAYAMSASVLRPMICTSIGAGRPKFKILAVMSPGGKVYAVPGNSLGSLARRIERYSSTGEAGLLRLIVTSQSCGPIVALAL